MRKSKWIITAALSSGTAMAVPVVIYDSGKTESMSRYLPAIEKAAPSKSAHSSPAVDPSLEHLPVRTPEMTPGPVIPKRMGQPHLSRPLFLVGYDDRSKRWLEHYREKLVAARAVGVIVNVETRQELEELRKIGQALEMVAASGSQLGKQLGLIHYPLLISRFGIEQ